MTFTKQDADGVWVSGPLVAAVFTIVCGLVFAVYQADHARLWEDGNAITQLKTEMTNSANETTRIEGVIGSINQSLTVISTSMTNSKDSIDTLKDQIHDLQKQVQSLYNVLRSGTVPSPP